MRYLFFISAIILFSCQTPDPVLEKKKSHPSHKYTFIDMNKVKLQYEESDYLPVYSDIYNKDGSQRFSLTTTISIRNNSISDSAYIQKATYYDSYGKILMEYIDSAIVLSPLESIEFVVQENEKEGGAGANFIINWGATHYSDQILIQSVMFGTFVKQGVSFITNAKVIDKKIF